MSELDTADIRFASQIVKGDKIFTTTETGVELWKVERVEDNSRPMPNVKDLPSGRAGFVLFVCDKGSVMHEVNGGVFVKVVGHGH